MKQEIFLQKILSLTAWEMTPPKPYSAFHLLLGAAGIATAVLAARWLAARRLAARTAQSDDASPAAHRSQPVTRTADRTVLFSCGLVLLALETYKQGFLYFVEFNGVYDWWYFPFQLCSIPMYLCLLYPFSGKFSGILASFIQYYGLLGGIMALLVPDGLMHPYWTMTLHGFLWHFLLIFSGIFCAFSGASDRSMRGFFKTVPLFFTCCLIAIFINIAAGPLSDADMFYISPYHPSSQPVFHRFSLALGILPGILLYIGAILLGAFLVHLGCRQVNELHKKKS